MPKYQVRFKERFAAPPDRVFDFFADHAKFARLLGMKAERVKAGQDPADANGLGSVRRISSPPFTLEETITAYRKPELIEYMITKGGPLKNHHGTIRFSATPDGGTAVDYTIVFDGKFPLIGGIVESKMKGGWAASVPKCRPEIEAA